MAGRGCRGCLDHQALRLRGFCRFAKVDSRLPFFPYLRNSLRTHYPLASESWGRTSLRSTLL